LKRRSGTKKPTNKPHDPHELYLDEDVSGKAFASLLGQAKIIVHQYEKLLPRNKKIPDATVIKRASKARFVLVTADKRMESVWTDDIVAFSAKVILLMDEDGGPIHWASALVAGENGWRRALLDNLVEPVVIKIGRTGTIIKLVGPEELRKRRDHIMTAKIVRAKKLGLAL
jgi:hypothetical protein